LNNNDDVCAPIMSDERKFSLAARLTINVNLEPTSRTIMEVEAQITVVNKPLLCSPPLPAFKKLLD
jgi:hypothetical protein